MHSLYSISYITEITRYENTVYIWIQLPNTEKYVHLRLIVGLCPCINYYYIMTF